MSSQDLLFDVSGWTTAEKVHFIYLLGIDTNAPGWWEGDHVERIVSSGWTLDYAAGVAYKLNTGADQWDLRPYKRDAKPWANPQRVYDRCLREQAAKKTSAADDDSSSD